MKVCNKNYESMVFMSINSHDNIDIQFFKLWIKSFFLIFKNKVVIFILFKYENIHKKLSNRKEKCKESKKQFS